MMINHISISCTGTNIDFSRSYNVFGVRVFTLSYYTCLDDVSKKKRRQNRPSQFYIIWIFNYKKFARVYLHSTRLTFHRYFISDRRERINKNEKTKTLIWADRRRVQDQIFLTREKRFCNSERCANWSMRQNDYDNANTKGNFWRQKENTCYSQQKKKKVPQ